MFKTIIMKLTYQPLSIILAAIVLLTGCMKDLGSYSYHDINEVTIEDLGGPYTVLFKIDTLEIKPSLSFSMDESSSKSYKYEWKFSNPENENQRTLVSTERDLSYPVELLPGSYTLYYNVYDEETEVTWSTNTSINVSTASATGFIITGEDEDGFTDVDMVAILSSDTVIMKSLLKDNGMPQYRSPIRALHTGTTSSPNNVKFWVLTEEGSYYMNTTTFETSPENEFKNLVFSTFDLPEQLFPIEIAPRVFSNAGNSTGTFTRLALTNSGHIFYSSLFSGDFYSNPVNRVASKPEELFKCAPYLMYTPVRWDSYIVFDQDNKRFLRGSGGGVPSEMLSFLNDDGGPFPWDQSETGRDLVYAENTKDTQGGSMFGNSFALMQGQGGDYHIYKFYVNYVLAPVKLGYYPVKAVAESFNQADHYAFASNRTLLFYAVGSRLYAYDYNPGLEKGYFIKDFGEEITMLNFDIQAGNGDELYVATYSQLDKGTIRKFTLNTDLNNLEVSESDDVEWKGLVKVKSMDWRRSTQ